VSVVASLIVVPAPHDRRHARDMSAAWLANRIGARLASAGASAMRLRAAWNHASSRWSSLCISPAEDRDATAAQPIAHGPQTPGHAMTFQREVQAPRTFSFEHEPLTRVLRRLHLVTEDGAIRARLLVAIAWLPLCLGALARLLLSERPERILFDLSVHTRLLVAIPMLVLAGHLLALRCRAAVEQLYEGELTDLMLLDKVVDRAERLRDSRVAIVVILAIAVFSGQSVLWGLSRATGVLAGIDSAGGLSFATFWYCCIALPIAQLLMLRWLWHWAIWSYVVLHVSRLPLATIAMHPDHAGGLSFLGGPITAFSMFTFAISSVMAGAWGTKILHGRDTMQTFVPEFVAFVLVVAFAACAPQLAYIGKLYNARHRATRPYHMFALRYVRDFHRKWLVTAAPDELGSADIQALNDLGGSYGSLERTRLLPMGTRLIAGLWIAALIPMLPIVSTAIPVSDLIKHIGSIMLGGLPL
jgi:hypothetical protein